MSRWIEGRNLLSRWGIHGICEASRFFYRSVGTELPAFEPDFKDGRIKAYDSKENEELIWRVDVSNYIERWDIPDESMRAVDDDYLNELKGCGNDAKINVFFGGYYYKMDDVESFERRHDIVALLEREYGITPPKKVNVDIEEEREDASKCEPGQLAAGKDKTTRERWKEYLQTAVMMAVHCVEEGGSYTKPELDEMTHSLGREALTEEAMQAFRSAMPEKYIHSGGRKKKPQEN